MKASFDLTPPRTCKPEALRIHFCMLHNLVVLRHVKVERMDLITIINLRRATFRIIFLITPALDDHRYFVLIIFS